MVRVKPFAAVRPPQSLVKEVASRPYDVLNSSEAQAEANRILAESVTDPLIDYQTIEKWDGQLPQVTMGESGSPLIGVTLPE